jgi:hypothetical protein
MTKAFKEEKSQVAESSNNISKSIVQVELDELKSQSDEEPHSNDQEQDTPDQIGLNATKDHRSGMVLRILSLMLYLPVARILLHFRKQLKALKRISGWKLWWRRMSL